MARPAVLFGGPSPEHDVSILLGLPAARALVAAGVEVETIYWAKSGELFLVEPNLEAEAYVDGVPPKARPLRLHLGSGGGFVPDGGSGIGRRPKPLDISAVVNCCHGGPGEDGTLQGALDLAGVRYTGPSVAGAALGMDKLAFASVVTAADLPHLPMALPDGDEPPFDGPFIVKPRFGGSSIGIEILSDWSSVLAFVRSPQPALRAGAVVEPYRSDAYDLNIAIRTWPELELSAIEKPIRQSDGDGGGSGGGGSGAGILDYRDKYQGGEGMATAPRQLPAEIPDGWATRIREAARKLASVAGVRGVARLDFLAAGGDIFVNEINTIPGSMARHLWVDPPIAFSQLLEDLISEATQAPPRSFPTQGADGSILRSASSIAAKLA